jgi:hypothetical protein
MMEEMFDSNCRSEGDLAGVFEFADGVGYFYLYDHKRPDGEKVVDSILILRDDPDFRNDEVKVRWNRLQNKVGLSIRGAIWALFDIATGEKYGGNYRARTTASLPPNMINEFD